jgi:ankyrin repeat protein
LPPELLLKIANYLDDAEMNALACTNKYVHNLLNELLYRRDVIKSPSRSLTLGARNGVKGTIQWAVDASQNFNLTPESFHIALQVAAKKGHVPIVELLLKVHGIDPNFVGNVVRGSLRAAPLLLAAEEGHSAIVELLLAVVKVKADVRDTRDYRGNIGYTPLIYACREGHVSIVEQLLARHDVNFNARGNFRSTPLIVACIHNQVEIVNLLLAKRGDLGLAINIVDNSGDNALVSAAFYGYIDIVKLLLDHPDVNPNVVGVYGTALMNGSRGRSPGVVKLLLDHKGIDVNVRSNSGHGKTALSEAAYFNSVECAKLLLERHDINVNIPDRDGRTAFHHACYEGSSEIIKLILERDNIDPNALDRNGVSIFSVFMRNRHMMPDRRVAGEIESLLRAAARR